MKSRLARVTLMLLFLIVGTAYAEDHSVDVLVNNQVSTTELTPAQLRKIFSMRQTVWPDGQAIVVFVFDSQTPAHQALCKEVLKMFPYQIERLWNKLAYSGLGEKPIEVTTEQAMLEKLRDTPGAIGYVKGSVTLDGLHAVTIKENLE